MSYSNADIRKIVYAYLKNKDLSSDTSLPEKVHTDFQRRKSILRSTQSNNLNFIYEILFDFNWSESDAITRVQRIHAVRMATIKAFKDEKDREATQIQLDELNDFFNKQYQSNDWQESALGYRDLSQNALQAGSQKLSSISTNTGTPSKKISLSSQKYCHLGLTDNHYSGHLPYSVLNINTLNIDGTEDGEIGVAAYINQADADADLIHDMTVLCGIYLSAFNDPNQFYRDTESVFRLIKAEYLERTGQPLPSGFLYYRKYAGRQGYNLITTSNGDVGMFDWSARQPDELRKLRDLSGTNDDLSTKDSALKNKMTLITCSKLIYESMPFNLPKEVRSCPTIQQAEKQLEDSLAQLTSGSSEKDVTQIILNTYQFMQKNKDKIAAETKTYYTKASRDIKKIEKNLASDLAAIQRLETPTQSHWFKRFISLLLSPITQCFAFIFGTRLCDRKARVKHYQKALDAYNKEGGMRSLVNLIEDQDNLNGVGIMTSSHNISPKFVAVKNSWELLNGDPLTPPTLKPRRGKSTMRRLSFSSPIAALGTPKSDRSLSPLSEGAQSPRDVGSPYKFMSPFK